MTGSDRHSSPTNDPLASQRAELLGKAIGAQFELERALAEVARSGGAALAEGREQLETLRQLQQQIGAADGASFASLRRELTTALATVQVTTAHVRSAVVSATLSETAEVAHLAASVRTEVQSFVHDFYDRKIFDRYLHFASAEDETDYRKREEASRRAIEAALAKGTPEGDLEAARLAEAQLRDAGAHGTDASPDYAHMRDRLSLARSPLQVALEPPSAGITPPPSSRSTTDASADHELDAVLAALTSAGVYTSAEPASGAVHGLSDLSRAARDKGSTGLG